MGRIVSSRFLCKTFLTKAKKCNFNEFKSDLLSISKPIFFVFLGDFKIKARKVATYDVNEFNLTSPKETKCFKYLAYIESIKYIFLQENLILLARKAANEIKAVSEVSLNSNLVTHNKENYHIIVPSYLQKKKNHTQDLK